VCETVKLVLASSSSFTYHAYAKNELNLCFVLWQWRAPPSVQLRLLVVVGLSTSANEGPADIASLPGFPQTASKPPNRRRAREP